MQLKLVRVKRVITGRWLQDDTRQGVRKEVQLIRNSKI